MSDIADTAATFHPGVFYMHKYQRSAFPPCPPSYSLIFLSQGSSKGKRLSLSSTAQSALCSWGCCVAPLDKVKMSWAKPQSTASSRCRGDLPLVTNDDQHFPWASSKLDRWQCVLWTGARSICLAFQMRGLKLKAKHARSLYLDLSLQHTGGNSVLKYRTSSILILALILIPSQVLDKALTFLWSSVGREAIHNVSSFPSCEMG